MKIFYLIIVLAFGPFPVMDFGVANDASAGTARSKWWDHFPQPVQTWDLQTALDHKANN
ncbi:MAG: hypothetical protein GY847_05510 [Proteobacteria bacterium]|nr:hypothetical protein [Pseudomonadota bacterium]